MNYSRILPTIIQHDFLNKDEISDIKEKVFQLRHLWEAGRPVSQILANNPYRFKTTMLSIGMYTRDYDSYIESVKKFKSIMGQTFNVYYVKVKTKLQSYFEKPVNFLDGANYPGFHVFSLDNDQALGTRKFVDFHRDAFEMLHRFTQRGEIVSVVVPITLPNIGGSLLYTMNETHPAKKYITGVDYLRLEYTPGMLAIWGGNVFHSIEPFSIAGDSPRITMQMHLNIKENDIDMFW